MAVVAGVLAVDVISVFAGCDHPVMTGGAGPQHLEVIHPRDRRPQGRAMAGLAYIATLDVGIALAGGRHAVMAGLAITHNAHMIKIRR